jgi:hypothetical protein
MPGMCDQGALACANMLTVVGQDTERLFIERSFNRRTDTHKEALNVRVTFPDM